MPEFIDVEYLPGWRLFVVLSDGMTGELDLSSWRSRPPTPTLQDEREFARVTIDDRHRLSWPDGCLLTAGEIYHQLRH